MAKTKKRPVAKTKPTALQPMQKRHVQEQALAALSKILTQQTIEERDAVIIDSLSRLVATLR